MQWDPIEIGLLYTIYHDEIHILYAHYKLFANLHINTYPYYLIRACYVQNTTNRCVGI